MSDFLLLRFLCLTVSSMYVMYGVSAIPTVAILGGTMSSFDLDMWCLLWCGWDEICFGCNETWGTLAIEGGSLLLWWSGDRERGEKPRGVCLLESLKTLDMWSSRILLGSSSTKSWTGNIWVPGGLMVVEDGVSLSCSSSCNRRDKRFGDN